MPTAIRQVELSRDVAEIGGVPGSERCMLVFRWRGVVVGRAFVPLPAEGLSARAIADCAASHLKADAVQAWLEDALGFDERGDPGAPTQTATVAICTRERPEDLARTLAAVCALEPAPHAVIVIDNAPATARTKAVVERFPRVRYVVEPVRGLNRARNRALREAGTHVVAFTDDDATPEPQWLESLLVNFRDSRVLCVTGLTLPSELETPAQELFEQHCSFVRGFSRRAFDGRVDNPLIVARAGAGANMAVRRTLPDIAGWFDERLDAGTPTMSGGDHEMFTRILSAGRRIIYDPRAVSWHRHRRTFEELDQVVRGYGTGVYAMWTGLFLERRDLSVLRLAWRWFRWDHLPLFRSPSRLVSDDPRDRLLRAELAGCLTGPRAWFSSRRASQARP